MQGLQDIDIEAACAIWDGNVSKELRQQYPLEEGDDRWLSKVLTGSSRPASRLYKAKVLPSPACPFCDTEEEETKEHCFWRCPRGASIRAEALHSLQQEGFQMENPEDPTPTRSGAPALWWCGLMNEGPALEEALTTIGDEDFVVDPPPPRDFADLEPEEAAGGSVMKERDARLDRRSRGSFGSGLEPEPPRQIPPKTIVEHVQIGTLAYFADLQLGDKILKLNGFTPEDADFHEQRWKWDLQMNFQGMREVEAGERLEQWVEEESGGVTMRRLLLATDGSGLHPTDRRLRRYGYGLFRGSGRHPWNRVRRLLGPHQVVPRAELRVLLEAVRMTDLPIKVLVDCAFVVDGFELLDQGKDTSHLDHQDLWEALREALQGGVPHRVQVTKVKAHTSLQDVEQGIISFRDRWYNDEVDQLAKDGAKLDELPAGAVHAARQRKKWAIILQMMQVRILKARDPFLQTHKKEMERRKPPRVVAHTLPGRPAFPARGPCPGATVAPSVSVEVQQDAVMELEREHDEDPQIELQQQRIEELEAMAGVQDGFFDDQEDDDEHWVQRDAQEARQVALRARQHAEVLEQQDGVSAVIARDLRKECDVIMEDAEGILSQPAPSTRSQVLVASTIPARPVALGQEVLGSLTRQVQHAVVDLDEDPLCMVEDSSRNSNSSSSTAPPRDITSGRPLPGSESVAPTINLASGVVGSQDEDKENESAPCRKQNAAGHMARLKKRFPLFAWKKQENTGKELQVVFQHSPTLEGLRSLTTTPLGRRAKKSQTLPVAAYRPMRWYLEQLGPRGEHHHQGRARSGLLDRNASKALRGYFHDRSGARVQHGRGESCGALRRPDLPGALQDRVPQSRAALLSGSSRLRGQSQASLPGRSEGPPRLAPGGDGDFQFSSGTNRWEPVEMEAGGVPASPLSQVEL